MFCYPKDKSRNIGSIGQIASRVCLEKVTKTRCIPKGGDRRYATGPPQPLPAFLSFDLVLAYLLPLDTQFANSTYRTGATKAIVLSLTSWEMYVPRE